MVKTNLSGFYKKDDEKVNKGIWFMLNEEVGFLVCFAGAKNKEFKKVAAEMFRPVQKSIDKGLMSKKAQGQLQLKAFVKSCITGWKGIENEETGEPLEFSNDMAMEILLSEEHEELLGDLLMFATDGTNFQIEDDGDEVGN